MPESDRFFSNLPQKPTSRPSDGFPAIGVIADLGVPRSIIGVAYPYTHIGGCKVGQDPLADHTPPEVVWRLVLDRAWRDGRIVRLESEEILEGRYVLRDGEFIELSEAAS